MQAFILGSATVLPCLWIAVALAEPVGDQGWSQWRGPHRNGQIEDRNWPGDLSSRHLTQRWSVPQGPSYSGPIVVGDRLIVTETDGQRDEVVRALNRNTGEQMWQTRWPGAMRVPFFANANGSWIRATPACDGSRLYVAGMRDLLVCLDVETGEILWQLDFVKETGSELPKFGYVSSPLIVGEHVYVQAGGSFAKLNKYTGQILWQTLEDSSGMYGSAFSSPVFATIAGVPQIVVQTRSKLAGVDLQQGTVLWSQQISAFRGMNILTPTVIADSVFTSSYGGRSAMFKIGRVGSEWTVSKIWNHKSQAYMSSPVVVKGHIYLHLRNQRLVCLDVKTGSERWTSKPFGKYWSMITNGDKLLVLDQRGELLLLDPSPQAFKLISRRQVADDAWAHLAISNGQLFVRDLHAIKAYSWQ